jgi:hypothetical protein
MKRIPILLAIFGLIAVTSISASADVVNGIVVGAGGKPIPGAYILAFSRGKDPRVPDVKAFQSDKEGRFTYSPSSDIFSLEAVAEGYSYGGYDTQKKQTGEVCISLRPEQKLTGKVVDENGKPLSGVTVSLEHLQASEANGRNMISYQHDGRFPASITAPELPSSSSVSGKDGGFALPHIPDPDGLQYIQVGLVTSKLGRARMEKFMQIQNALAPVTITVPPACRLTGRVYPPGKKGALPDHAIMTAQILQDGHSTGRPQEAKLDKEGKFCFSELPPGKVNVIMSIALVRSPSPKAEFPTEEWVLPAAIGIELKPRVERMIELVGVKAVTARGTVIDKSTGKPVAGAAVFVCDRSRPEYSSSSYRRTNDKGEFTARVAPGKVDFRVQGFQNGKSYVFYQPGDEPMATLIASGSVDPPAVTISVDPTTMRQPDYEAEKLAQTKPIPPDFEFVPGTYSLAWDSDLDCSWAMETLPALTGDKVLHLIKKLPKLVSKKPMAQAYRIDSMDDSRLLFVVLDESKGTGKGYDRAYIDANRNGDLSDDKPLSWNAAENFYQKTTESVSVPCHQGKPGPDQTQYPVRLALRVTKSDSYFSANLQRKGCWHGTVDTNKGKIEFALMDWNTNGTYGDFPTITNYEPKDLGDLFYADMNGVGKLSFMGNSHQRLALNREIAVAGKVYTVRPNETGNKVAIERYTGPTGTLVVKGKNIGGLTGKLGDIALTGEDAYFEIHDCCDKPLVLPSGKYKLIGYSLMLDSKQRADMGINLMTEEMVEVKAGEVTNVVVGGKLTGLISPDTKDLVLKAKSSERISWIVMIGQTQSSMTVSDQGMRSNLKVEFFDQKKNLIYTTGADYT